MREILKSLMDANGDDAYTLEDKSGVPQPTTQRFLSGKHKSANEATVKRWADAYGVSPSQLRGDVPIDHLYEKGSDISISETEPFKSKSINKNNNYVINEYVDASGSMGIGVILNDQPGQIKKWTVTDEWLNKNLPYNTGKANLAIVTGFGDSMKGMFNSGDPLIIDIGINRCDYDGVYFFRVGNEGFVKRLQRIPGDGIRAISTNKEYESWTITKDMDFEVFGRVLKVWKSEEL